MYYYNRIIDEYLDSIASKMNMSMQVYLEAMFTYFLKYKDSLLMIHRAGVAHHILSALNALFISDDGKRSIDEVFRVYYHTGGIYNTFLLWFDKGMSISPKKLSEMSVMVLPKGQRPFLI